jgi:hypothetical protein
MSKKQAEDSGSIVIHKVKQKNEIVFSQSMDLIGSMGFLKTFSN